MKLQNPIKELKTPREVDLFLIEYPDCVIFKAGSCGVTDMAWMEVEPVFEANPELAIGIIQVVAWREASNYIEEFTKIMHQSPQLILFKGKKAVKAWSHFQIHRDSLTEMLKKSKLLRNGPTVLNDGIDQ